MTKEQLKKILNQWLFELEIFYGSKERVEWRNETYAERTERFEPPMWKEIKEYYCFNFVINNCPRCFVVEKGHYMTIDSDGSDNIFEEYASDVTEENYEKACKIVRSLFMGDTEWLELKK